MSSLCAHEILLVAFVPIVSKIYQICYYFFFAQTLPEYNKEKIISCLVWIKQEGNSYPSHFVLMTLVENDLTGYEMTLGTK